MPKANHTVAPEHSYETRPQDGYSRQAVMIANVLLEGREHMRLDLGPEIEEALAKDLEESAEAANVKRKPAAAV
jgi:hypothetical protein